MDPKAQFVCYLVALFCFAIATFWGLVGPEPRSWRGIHFGWAGALAISIVLLVTAYKAI